MPNTLQQQLQQGVESLGLSLTINQIQKLEAYLHLLERWNKTFNLTAIRDINDMVTQHIIDSLAIVPHIQGPDILDIGSGAGLPGMPLAIYNPDWRLTLMDKNGKKTRFLVQCKAELGLDNIEIAQARVETYQSERLYATITARALGSVANIVNDAQHLLADHGCFVLMKGRVPSEELAQLDERWEVMCQALTVPGLAAERHVIHVQRRKA